jgi:hypothetical protein
MTTVCFASLKGAPGVTTLATLVAGAWPLPHRAIVAEWDPSGGDLAARFQLSARCGWSSFAAACRRHDGAPPLLPHLQHLPGGQAVLVGPRSALSPESVPSLIDLAIESASSDEAWDLLVDLGRIMPDGRHAVWLDRADHVVIVAGTDAASVLHVHDQADLLLSRCVGRLGLVLIERKGYGNEEIEEFTGLPVMARVPHDPTAATALTGHPGPRRRLARSPLLASGGRLAVALAGDAGPPGALVTGHLGPTAIEPGAKPSTSGVGQARAWGRPGWLGKVRWFGGQTSSPAAVTEAISGRSDERSADVASEQAAR